MAKKKSVSAETRESERASADDFESALAQVEKVVERLESGELGLSEALAQYEIGIEKIKVCHRALEQAELRIAVLTEVDENGSPRVEPVDRIPPRRDPEQGGRSHTIAREAARTWTVLGGFFRLYHPSSSKCPETD